MINYESIISVFNEKGTLLKWLKKVEKALKESILTNVEVLQGENNTFAFNFTFEDNTSITTEYVAINPQITASQLHELIGGSSTIVVDLNELQNKLIVKLDEEYKKTLATQSDVENLESELTNKQNEIVDSEEIVKHSDEENKLYLNNNVSNKINKALQIPADAPTATELVGVDTNKAQVNIGIGEGLSLENGTLKASGGSGDNDVHTHYLILENTGVTHTFIAYTMIVNNNINEITISDLQSIFESTKIFATGEIREENSDIFYAINAIEVANEELHIHIFTGNVISSFKTILLADLEITDNVI